MPSIARRNFLSKVKVPAKPARIEAYGYYLLMPRGRMFV